MKILKNIFIIVISFILSIGICYYGLDNLIGRFTYHSYVFIGVRITIFLFISLLLLKKLNIKIFTILYIVLILTITFRKGVVRSYNFNILQIFKDLEYTGQKLLLIGNIVMYIPVGFIIQLQHNKTAINILISIIGIFCVELIQYVFMLGIFDINDIILNVIGFITGILIYKIIRNRYI